MSQSVQSETSSASESVWNPDAHFIGPQEPDGSAPRFRKSFALKEGHGRVIQATLRATAFGVYEAFLDGTPVSSDVLAPGWSSYEWRLRYQTYDLTERLADSDRRVHVLAAVVGNGWYLGQLGWEERRNLYGNERGVLLQLDIRYEDGHEQTVGTDDSWQSQGSEILHDDLYDGQTIDCRRCDEGWADGVETARPWGPVRSLQPQAETRLTAPFGPPIRRQESLRPVKIWQSPSGRTLVDFGQNLVGWLRFRVSGAAGQEVVLKHAEVLEHGELGTRPLRHADATDRLVLSGQEDFFEPTFTFHGFRYVEVTGWPGELTADDLEAVVVHSDMARTGHFRTSNPKVNQLHQNVVWGLKGNFLDVPTDCPQRDERLGWTGDISVFAPTAARLYDVKSFLADWLRDLAAEQRAAQDLVPFVVPDVLKYQGAPEEFEPLNSTAIWSDAAVWVPWALYQAYGDVEILRNQYESMTGHVRRVETLLSDSGVWDTGFQFGDWLDPDASPHEPAAAKANPSVVATACVVRSARMVSEAAKLLGRDVEAAEFSDLARRVAEAFQDQYVDASGTIMSDCTTVYTLAIVFDLLTPEQRERAGERLSELVREADYRVSTGFAGTPYITEALSSTGHVEDAYLLLLEEECPSWMYPVSMGATTVWERWDSMLPDGTINPGEMTSFNHYALGSVAEWMYQAIGGIEIAEPGYARVRIRPLVPEGRVKDAITWADVSVDTRYGQVRSAWERDGDVVHYRVQIPEGVEAELALPGGEKQVLAAGEHRQTAVVSV
ncbi:alpha-L-rhamnosidase [Nesterenkonia cremea]|uniref:alpha-L-rhamnosidase n=1 Tax=Nesterenkonia cremea TaxID=1882340 RepID=A0A917EMQ7_9MICC|nr:alpha-L-rhamnosidase [Nesterenkonia cremea]GGE57396.1 alpha-L-rhamnosidase [Nesterenkonia cremea]